MNGGISAQGFALTEGDPQPEPPTIARMNSPDISRRFDLYLADERQTARLGATLAPLLGPGDTVLLRGDLGAGKSALARAAIGAALEDPEVEIPSPSYTLVNIYEIARGQIWHADLYRLSGDAEELEQLGLDDAIGAALVFIEWPERLGSTVPERRLEIALSAPHEGGRDVVVTLFGAGWDGIAALLAGWK